MLTACQCTWLGGQYLPAPTVRRAARACASARVSTDAKSATAGHPDPRMPWAWARGTVEGGAEARYEFDVFSGDDDGGAGGAWGRESVSSAAAACMAPSRRPCWEVERRGMRNGKDGTS